MNVLVERRPQEWVQLAISHALVSIIAKHLVFATVLLQYFYTLFCQISMNAHRPLASVDSGPVVITIMEHFMNVPVKMEQYSQE